MSTDWKVYGVLVEGTKGYPLCHTVDQWRGTFHLCPSCARRWFEQIDPRSWGRLVKSAA